MAPKPRNMLTLGAILFVGLFSVGCRATFDLNMQELEMVADHLTPAECRILSESLHSSEYKLPQNLTGNEEPQLPCVDLLLHWDENEGRGQSFVHLCLRLKQIGRKDVADKLSKTVNHEKSEAVERSILVKPGHSQLDEDSEEMAKLSSTSKPKINLKIEMDLKTILIIALPAAAVTIIVVVLCILSIRAARARKSKYKEGFRPIDEISHKKNKSKKKKQKKTTTKKGSNRVEAETA